MTVRFQAKPHSPLPRELQNVSYPLELSPSSQAREQSCSCTPLVTSEGSPEGTHSEAPRLTSVWAQGLGGHCNCRLFGGKAHWRKGRL